MPKKVYFDALNAALKKGTGVATYARTLARTATSLGHETGLLYSTRRRLPRRPLEREVAFFDDTPEIGLPSSLRMAATGALIVGSGFGARAQALPHGGRVIPPAPFLTDETFGCTQVFDRARGWFELTGQFLKVSFPAKPDLFHWTFPLPIKATAGANIYTVHDLVPIRLPYTTLDWKRHYIRTMRAILRRADHIVTVSEHSKRDIVEIFGADERRITNTYQAVQLPADLIERSTDDIAAELAGVFGLDMQGYLLFFGSLEPKKNLGRLVQAYLSANVDIPLIVVVAQSWQSDDETRLLNAMLDDDRSSERHGAPRRIRRYDYLPSRLLVTLVQGARAVLMPSLYEGFGLPVLEAMTLGTPVIASRVSSIPEVAGDAAVLIDPYDIDDIRKAIRAVTADNDLRRDLVEKGRARAKIFSTEAYEQRVDALYRQFL